MNETTSYAKSLRRVADLIEANPELAPGRVTLKVVTANADDFRAAVRKLGGRREKELANGQLQVERAFGAVTVRVSVQREAVCRRVKKGTRVVSRPDPDAPRIEMTEDVYEWVCEPIM